MNSWRFQITDDGERDIRRLDAIIEKRVRERLAWFAERFEETVSSPLKFEFRGFSKLRVGDWRVVYEIKELERIVLVHGVDHRSKVYKKRR